MIIFSIQVTYFKYYYVLKCDPKVDRSPVVWNGISHKQLTMKQDKFQGFADAKPQNKVPNNHTQNDFNE